jgi:NAD-dependent dihydropyrimidine dehydrogenase PreA subunit
MVSVPMFVRLEVDADLCAREPACRECVQSCPVDIFFRNDGDTAHSIPDNEDECILCDQCVERCPVNAVTLVKLY